jgi:hypothetical protein
VHLGFWERSSLVWNQEAVKDHQDRLSRQTAAMQLLLMAIQWYGLSIFTGIHTLGDDMEDLR